MYRKLVFLFFGILAFSYQSYAQGDLLVTPRRIVFEGNKQREAINLVNTGKDSATYSISFVQRNMNEDGSFVNIEKPDSGQMFADPYMRIFPRKVTLAPGEPQVIMLQYRRSAEMKEGEYRSHLYFRSEKNYSPLGMDKAKIDTSLLSVQLIPIYGMSIPVIIRIGLTDVKATLSNIELQNQQDTLQYLKLCINRSGNISTYGDIIVEYIPDQGKSYEVGLVKGMGVYTNISKRYVSIKLNKISGTILKKGKLKVQYKSNDDAKPFVYAEGELDITNH